MTRIFVASLLVLSACGGTTTDNDDGGTNKEGGTATDSTDGVSTGAGAGWEGGGGAQELRISESSEIVLSTTVRARNSGDSSN